MNKRNEKINKAIEYWRKHLNSYCEKGSARDYLAITDLKLFMDELDVSYATIRSLEDDRTDQEEKISSLKKTLEDIRQDNVHTLDFSGHCVRCGDSEVSHCVREIASEALKLCMKEDNYEKELRLACLLYFQRITMKAIERSNTIIQLYNAITKVIKEQAKKSD